MEKIKKFGIVKDSKDKYIGKYIYIEDSSDQEVLDRFCKSWLDSYKNDSRFFITFDLETTGLDPLNGDILLVSVCCDGQNSLVFRPHTLDLTLWKKVLNTVPVSNTNIKFDLKWAIHHWGVDPYVFFDTMIAAQLGWAGVFPENSFGLANLAKQLLKGYSLDKTIRENFIGRSLSTTFTNEEIAYSASDSIITHLLVFPIKQRLANTQLELVWEDIERPLISVLAKQELEGILIDLEAVKALHTIKTRELVDINAEIQYDFNKIPNPPPVPKGVFNPGSPKQVVDVLQSFNIHVLSTREIALEEALNGVKLTTNNKSGQEFLEKIIRFRSTKSEISKYLESWISDHIDPNTHKIHTNFSQLKVTGRMGSGSPNVQNIPPGYRHFIIAPPGWKVVSQDFCYDDQTEVLTDQGWKLFKDLNKTELFYSMDPKTHVCELVPATRYIENDYSGNLIETIGEDVDLLVTPHHKHYVSLNGGKEWETFSAYQCTAQDNLLFLSGGINEPFNYIKNFDHRIVYNYFGKVYCVTLERNHLLYVRRNGKAVWSQNSQFEFRACAAKTNEEYLIKSFRDRADLLPVIMPIALNYGFKDPDGFVKAVKKGSVQVSSVERNLIDRFSETDIHVQNAAKILDKPVSQVDYLRERSVGKCVALDTYVTTNKGLRTVRSFLPKKPKADTFYDLKGIKVLTDEGFKESPQLYYSGKHKAVKITTKAGRVLTCAPHHRLRSSNKIGGDYCWVQAGDLSPGMELFIKTDRLINDGTKSKNSSLLKVYSYIFRYGIGGSKEDSILSSSPDLLDALKDLGYKGKISKDKELITCPEAVKALVEDHFPDDAIADIDFKSVVDILKIMGDQSAGALVIKASVRVAQQLLNLLSNIGVSAWYRYGSIQFFGYDAKAILSLINDKEYDWDIKEGCDKLRRVLPDSYQEKAIEDRNLYYQEFAEKYKKVKLLKFFVDNGIRKDWVVSVENIDSIEMADFVVPENSTVVYEGLITHNTIGYAILYGAGAARIQDSLLSDNFIVTLKDCENFLNVFKRSAPKVGKYLDTVAEDVCRPKNVNGDCYVETHLGRKRFFQLPPKWQTRYYNKEYAKARNEGSNSPFQGANADATKLAMVRTSQEFQDVFGKYGSEKIPRIVLSVHDEVVFIAPDELVDEAIEINKNSMVESGEYALGGQCVVEVSVSSGQCWQK